MQIDAPLLGPHAALELPHVPDGIRFSAFQILPAPVDNSQADVVRFADRASLSAHQPRVLLPLPVSNHIVNLSAAKTESAPIYIWIDAYIPETVSPGDYSSNLQLQIGSDARASLPMQLTVQNLTLPSDVHLHIAAPLEWASLAQHYPDLFQPVPPRLLTRNDPRQAKLIQLLDSLQQIAHDNRTDFFLPQIQPIVKWPLGKPPEIDWSNFDSVVSGWFDGTAFADHQPVGFWPLPVPDSLEQFDLHSKIQFWKLAAEHFSAGNWKVIHPVELTLPIDITASAPQLLSAEASQILQADPTLQAIVPVEDQQTSLTDPRLICSAPGPISVENPTPSLSSHFLSPSKFPTAGFTQQRIRSLAWQAFSDNASIILCNNPLPPVNQSAQAEQITWVYPGQSFGVDHPLATTQLKWLRQAEQDYQYLLLAKQHDIDTRKLCQLVTQPVLLKPNQPAQPLFDLFTGQADEHVCDQARQILVDQMLSGTNQTVTKGNPLNRIRWLADHERQFIVPTTVDWKWNLTDSRIDATLQMTMYNTADQMPQGGHLQWLPGENAWESNVAPVPSCDRFHITSADILAHFNPRTVSNRPSPPIQIQYTDDFTRQTINCQVALPIAVSQRHPTPLVIDGNLNDWYPADAILLNEPMVNMLNQKSVKTGTLQPAPTPTSLYSGWSDDHFYLSFRLGGVVASDLRSTRNFVAYDHGRAWGEDLCELLIQPIYIDNYTGPLLHLVCKPGGSWVEHRASDQTWQPFEASGVRYASGVDSTEKIWRGEVAIPWRAINAPGHGRPALLRFNCIQHQQGTAQSASWAGPIDQSRDGKITGLLLIKE